MPRDQEKTIYASDIRRVIDAINERADGVGRHDYEQSEADRAEYAATRAAVRIVADAFERMIQSRGEEASDDANVADQRDRK